MVLVVVRFLIWFSNEAKLIRSVYFLLFLHVNTKIGAARIFRTVRDRSALAKKQLEIVKTKERSFYEFS